MSRLFDRPAALLFAILAAHMIFFAACTAAPAAPPSPAAVQVAGATAFFTPALPALLTPAAATAVPAVPSPTPPPPATSTPVPTMTAVPLTLNNPVDEALRETAVAAGVPFVLHDDAKTGIQRYPDRSFLHPIALAVRHDAAYLLDGGRVLALNWRESRAARLLLQPGDVVDGVTVIEILDMTAADEGLLALDRAGDVYRYEWDSGVWQLERYDRPIEESSDHYYVALAQDADTRYLLETSYRYVRRYRADAPDRLWNLPESWAVDVAARGDDVYVLAQQMVDESGALTLYRETARIGSFGPQVPIVQPRQVVATETAVYVLDQAGRRIWELEPATGALLAVHQPPGLVSVIGVGEDGRLFFAAADHLYVAGRPELRLTISDGPTLVGVQPHDAVLLASLDGLIVPVSGSGLTQRELQMPGAPRHYRLGVHEGIDYYWRPGTAVRAIADGIVIRASHDYLPPTEAQYAHYRAQVQQLGFTPSELLDIYRGRQVWIQHANGLVSRYAHLSEIAPDIVHGASVSQGQLLGKVGNSGSPASLEGETADAHLHFELWLEAHYLGQFLRPVETRALLMRLLGSQ